MASSFPPHENSSYPTWLGHGGFGVVLKAVAQPPLPDTAMKFIFPPIDPINDSADMTKIFRESTISSRLAPHPNILKILAVSQRKFSLSELKTKIFPDSILLTEDHQTVKDYFVGRAKRQKELKIYGIRIEMELCGENLRKWLNFPHPVNGPTLNLYQYTIIQNLTSGLKHLHGSKIIHRDLKPENVMFSKTGFSLPVKIGDFGLCRNIHSVESKTSSLTSRVGTQDYMAPESFGGKYDFKADLFSLGLVIWEVVQLIPFHKRKNLFDRLVNDKEENVIQNNLAFPDAAQLINLLTKKRTEDRPANMSKVTTLIQNWKPPEFKFYTNIVSTIIPPEGGNVLTAKNSSELMNCLLKAKPGSTINLLDNEYAGYFILNKDKVTLIGQGPSVVFNNHVIAPGNRLIVSGSYNNISNIQFSSTTDNLSFVLTGYHNCVNNVQFMGGQTGILISGGENHLENVHALKCDSPIQIRGCNNHLDNVKFDTIDDCGIYVAPQSGGNRIQNISGINMKRGIWCDGKNNNFSKINFSKTVDYKCEVGVMFDRRGYFNSISDLNCSNYGDNESDFVVYSNQCKCINCTCNTVFVGGEDVTLTKVNCSNRLVIGKKAGNSILSTCGGNRLVLEVPVIQKECRFETIVK